ncbi:hypothetical protein HDU93_000565 [Gonapodya sp. JEL0774]|nr:hypothetical protein HDU93_000565 [Gonapodya sp. JEL0774]
MSPGLILGMINQGAIISRYALQRITRIVRTSDKPKWLNPADTHGLETYYNWKNRLLTFLEEEGMARYASELLHHNPVMQSTFQFSDPQPTDVHDIDDMERFLDLVGAVSAHNVNGLREVQIRMQKNSEELEELTKRYGFVPDVKRWFIFYRWQIKSRPETLLEIFIASPKLAAEWCGLGLDLRTMTENFWVTLFKHDQIYELLSFDALAGILRTISVPAHRIPGLLFKVLGDGSFPARELAQRFTVIAEAMPHVPFRAQAQVELSESMESLHPTLLWAMAMVWPEIVRERVRDILTQFVKNSRSNQENWEDGLLIRLVQMVEEAEGPRSMVKVASDLLIHAVTYSELPSREWIRYLIRVVPDWEVAVLSNTTRPVSHCNHTLVRTVSADMALCPAEGGQLAWYRFCPFDPRNIMAQTALTYAILDAAERRAPDRVAERWRKATATASSDDEDNASRNQTDFSADVLEFAERGGWWVTPYHLRLLFKCVQDQGMLAELYSDSSTDSAEVFVFHNYGANGLEGLVEQILRMAQKTWLAVPAADCRIYVDEVLRGRGLKNAVGATLGEKLQEMWYRQYVALLRDVRKIARKFGVEISPVMTFQERLIDFLNRLAMTV